MILDPTLSALGFITAFSIFSVELPKFLSAFISYTHAVPLVFIVRSLSHVIFPYSPSDRIRVLVSGSYELPAFSPEHALSTMDMSSAAYSVA